MFQKEIILKSEDKGDELPNGLNVVLPFKRPGILNPAEYQLKLNLIENEIPKTF